VKSVSGKVYLVGAGPGAADLITLRAAQLLARADIVFYDALVNADTVALATRAEKVAVGKRCGRHSTAQRFINKRLIDAGQLKTRLYVMVRGSLASLQPFFAKGPVVDYAHHRMAVRAIKIVADGALGSRGAALLEPYTDEPGSRGLLTTPPEEIYAQTLAASKAGFQTAVHAIGDRANRLVLDTFERVQREVPGARALRMRVEHAQILDASEIPRFAALGVIASGAVVSGIRSSPPACGPPWRPR